MWIDKNGNPVGGSIILEMPFTNKDGGVELRAMRIFNPTDEQYIQAGCTQYTPPAPEPDPQYARYQQEFAAACAQFRAVCGQIKEAAQLDAFTGGFDEMVKFQQSAVYNTLTGLQLAMAWSAADKLCTYLGSKIGLGQPEWWYECWLAEQSNAPEEPAEPPVEDSDQQDAEESTVDDTEPVEENQE